MQFSRRKNKNFKDKQTQISRSKSKNLGAISKFWDVWNCRFLTFVCNFIFCPNQVIWKYCGKEKKGGCFKSLFLEYLPSFSNLKFLHSYAPNQTWLIFFFKIWPFAKSKQDFAKISCIQISKGNFQMLFICFGLQP